MKRKIPYETPERFRWTDIPTGIFFTIALIALGLALAINLRPLYYLNISWLGLCESTGLSSSVIKDNYNTLIDYCSPFYTGSLSFPTLSSSESGLSHFAECKVLFNRIYLAGLISLVICIISFAIKRHNDEYKYLRTCGIIAIVLPALLAIGSAINFDAVFLAFHRITFNNDDWLFDPATDPIINLLPETYFMECALLICAVVIIGAAIVFIIYGRRRKQHKEVRLLNPQKNYFY